MKTIHIILFSLLVQSAQTQVTSIDWEKCIGGSWADNPQAACYDSVAHTITIAGSSGSLDFDVTDGHGLTDAWIVQMDIDGNLLWEKTFGGTDYDIAFDIIRTGDGNMVFVGSTGSADGDVTFNHGLNDIWVVKIDAAGNLLWEKTIGGTSSELGNAICEADNGDLLITGYSNSDDGDFTVNYGMNDICVIRIDTDGNLIWTKTFGGDDVDVGDKILQHSNGKIIVAAHAHVDGVSDGYIVSLRDDGSVYTSQYLHRTPSCTIRDIIEKSDGSMLLFGETYFYKRANYTEHSDGALPDLLVMEIDSTLHILWDNYLGGNHLEQGYAGLSFSDGSYIAVGNSSSQNNGEVSGIHLSDTYASDAWLIKMDAAQVPIWQRCLGGSKGENAVDIIEIAPDDYIVICNSTSIDGDVTGYHPNDICYCNDYWILRLNLTCTPEKYYIDRDGDGHGSNNLYIYACGDTAGYSLYNDDCNDFNEMIFPGAPEFWNGIDDNCDGTIEFPVNDQGQADNLLIFPVPTFNITHVYSVYKIIEIAIYDTKGSLVLKSNPGSGIFDIDLSPFAAGVYSLQFIDEAGKANLVLIERIN